MQSAEKKEWRKRCRERRLALSLLRGQTENLLARLLTLLTEINPRSLGVYMALKGELDLAEPLMEWSMHRGVQLCLPFVYKDTHAMQYRCWNQDAPLVKDTAGIRTAIGEEITPEIVLSPCVGYSEKGYRLGNGGGYFDRWMAAHPAVKAVGLAFEELIVPDSLFNEKDIPMHWIVTERSIRHF